MSVEHRGTSSIQSRFKIGPKRYSGKVCVFLLLLVAATEAWPWGSDPTCPPGPEPTCPLKPIYDSENYFEHPTDCHYYIQCNGARRPLCRRCSPTTFFSTKIKNCVWPMDAACTHNDTTNPEGLLPPICGPGRCDLPGGKTRDPDCRYYWECKYDDEDETKVRKKCKEGQHYDTRISMCQDKCKAGCEKPETMPKCCKKGNCPYQEGTTEKVDCCTYKICERGTKVPRKCPPGQKYDPRSPTHCSPGECPPPCSSTPPPPCDEGTTERVDCCTYKICERGTKVPRKCPPGQKYDPRSPTHCSPGECPPPCSSTPPPPCDEGTTERVDCCTYKICERGTKVPRKCPPGQKYDPRSPTHCSPGECPPPCSSTPPPPCDEGTTERVDCCTYKICERGFKDTRKCPAGYKYDPRSPTHCIPGECPPPCSSTTPPPCDEGTTERVDCCTYKICERGFKETRKCPAGYKYDPRSPTHCIPGECPPPCSSTPPPPCDEGTTERVDCCTYKICERGTKVPRKCPLGQKYDPRSPIHCIPGECPPPCSSTTPPPCDEGTTERVDCCTYKICERGFKETRKCPAGYKYDPRSPTHCIPGECPPPCSSTGPPPCDEGTTERVDCCTYKICERGFKETRKCPAGYKYDPRSPTHCILGECPPPCSSTPPPPCDEGTTERVDCCTYKICERGFKDTRKCPAGYKYDPRSPTHCIPGECPPPCSSTGPPPCDEGTTERVDCCTYKICERGFKETRKCPAGYKYDPRSPTHCIPGECPPPCSSTPPPPCDEGTTERVDCCTYKICERGFKEIRKCPAGYKYDPRSPTHCIPGECPPPCSSTPPPPCDEGTTERVDCCTYKICERGFKETRKCPAGYKYDPRSPTHCIPGECPPPCSSTPPPPCDEGTTERVDCCTYKICERGFKETRKCPAGYKYDPRSPTHCIPGECPPPCSSTPPPPCDEGTTERVDCCTYKICERGTEVPRKCPLGQKYDPRSPIHCIPGECPPPCSSTPPPPCDEGTTERVDCCTYKICERGFKETRKCLAGYKYDPRSPTHCIPGECPPPCSSTPPPPCDEGTTEMVDCCTYKICERGTKVPRKCPLGQKYDPRSPTHCIPGECPPPCSSTPPPLCDEGTTERVDCCTYKICERGFKETRKCPAGYKYDPRSPTHCVPGECPHPCSSTPPPPCDEGTTERVDCCKYKICERGFKETRKCPAGYKYDPRSPTHCIPGECPPPCSSTPPTPCDEGTTERVDCCTYKICVRGFKETRKCPAGYKYDPRSPTHCIPGECPPPCSSTPPPPCDEGTTERVDCCTYKICERGFKETRKCPAGYKYDPRSPTHCIPGECPPPCSSTTPPPCDEGTTERVDCCTYKICERGFKETRKCPAGYKYDPRSPTHCIPGECPPPCSSTPPPPCDEGTTERVDCCTYKICVRGFKETRKCPAGYKYDPRSPTHCIPGECPPPCSSTPPPPCDEGTTERVDCYTYKICERGTKVPRKCPPGQKYDPRSATHCSLGDCPYPCSNQPCEEGTSEDPCSCDMYYKCENGDRVLTMCENGHHYNTTNKRCERPCVDVCPKLFFRKPECCASTKGKPEPMCPVAYSIFLPHPSDSRWFYQCKNGVRYCNRCPPGYRWNIDDDTCDKSCLCP